MKIFDYNHFVNERMKIMPITNDELDKAANYKMEEIEQPTYEDICHSGNIVCIECGGEQHHGIVMDKETSQRLTTISVYQPIIIILMKNGDLSYWTSSSFKKMFPYYRNNIFIKNVFRTCIDMSAINETGIKFIYKTYNLLEL
jgi:hypothetical protein